MILGTKDLHFTRDGALAMYCGLDAFKLAERFENGEDITPTLQNYQQAFAEVQAIAAQTGDGAWIMPVLRIFSRYCGKLGNYSIRDYRSVSALTDFVYTFGFIPDWECFADEQNRGSTQAQLQSHLDQMASAINGRYAFGSLGNEFHGNGYDPLRFTKPHTSNLWSRGSDYGDYCPPYPPWDYTKFHTRRDDLKGLIACQDLAWVVYDASGWGGPSTGFMQASIVDEPLGCADQYVRNARSNRPADFYRMAQEMAQWGAGGTFHSDCGINAVPFTPTQWACALAFIMGMSKVDPVQSFRGTIR